MGTLASEVLPDAAMLFTPEKSLELISSSPTPPQPPPQASEASIRKHQAFFISPPSIPTAQKKLYKMATETSLKSQVEAKVDEIIGEYLESNELYYFARYDGGIAHKVCDV